MSRCKLSPFNMSQNEACRAAHQRLQKASKCKLRYLQTAHCSVLLPCQALQRDFMSGNLAGRFKHPIIYMFLKSLEGTNFLLRKEIFWMSLCVFMQSFHFRTKFGTFNYFFFLGSVLLEYSPETTRTKKVTESPC